jgi:hypothetical protein
VPAATVLPTPPPLPRPATITAALRQATESLATWPPSLDPQSLWTAWQDLARTGPAAAAHITTTTRTAAGQPGPGPGDLQAMTTGMLTSAGLLTPATGPDGHPLRDPNGEPLYAATLPAGLTDGELDALRAAAHHLTDRAQRARVMTLLPPPPPTAARQIIATLGASAGRVQRAWATLLATVTATRDALAAQHQLTDADITAMIQAHLATGTGGGSLASDVPFGPPGTYQADLAAWAHDHPAPTCGTRSTRRWTCQAGWPRCPPPPAPPWPSPACSPATG